MSVVLAVAAALASVAVAVVLSVSALVSVTTLTTVSLVSVAAALVAVEATLLVPATLTTLVTKATSVVILSELGELLGSLDLEVKASLLSLMGEDVLYADGQGIRDVEAGTSHVLESSHSFHLG